MSESSVRVSVDETNELHASHMAHEMTGFGRIIAGERLGSYKTNTKDIT